MEFRAPTAATQLNARATTYLTENLSHPEAGRETVRDLIDTLGNCIETYPDWHPILSRPQRATPGKALSFAELAAYSRADHTVEFVRGFVTCPYSQEDSDLLMETVNEINGLYSYRLDAPLYADTAYPVVVMATDVQLEADGTIRSRDALAWFVQQAACEARNATVAETWWNIQANTLGSPHGSRSSLFVNQHAGTHMRKILEAMNESGMFGPIKEVSLAMLSEKKRDRIAETLLRAALASWEGQEGEFNFELRGEVCKARLRDTFDDGSELSIRVEIGNYDLFASGFYYPENDRITHVDPRGKRILAEKFL